MKALLSVYDKTGVVDLARGLVELRLGAAVERRHGRRARRRRAPGDRRGRPHRRARRSSATGSSPCTPRSTAGCWPTATIPSTWPTWSVTASRASTWSCRTSTRSRPTRRSSSSTSAVRPWCGPRPRTTRTSASWSTRPTTRRCSTRSARRARSASRPDASWPARRSPRPRPTTPRSWPGSTAARRPTRPAPLRADEAGLPPALDAHPRAPPGPALRREPAPGRRPLPRRWASDGWWESVVRARRQGDVLPQRVRHRCGLAAGALARRRPGRGRDQARQPVRRGAGRRHHHGLHRGPTSATRSPPTAASWPSTARSPRPWPRRSAPCSPRCWWRRGSRASALARLAGQEEPAHPRGVAARARWAPTLRTIDGGYLVQTPDHVRGRPVGVAGRHQGAADRRAVGRPRAGLAGRGPGDVQRHRARQGRPGVRHRVRPAEPARRRRARRREGGRSRPRAARTPATRSSRSPTGSTAPSRRVRPPSIQPGGSIRDDEVIAAADAAGLAMVFTGERHFRH